MRNKNKYSLVALLGLSLVTLVACGNESFNSSSSPSESTNSTQTETEDSTVTTEPNPTPLKRRIKVTL